VRRYHARRLDFNRVRAEAKHQGSIGLVFRRMTVDEHLRSLWRNRQDIHIHEHAAASEQLQRVLAFPGGKRLALILHGRRQVCTADT